MKASGAENFINICLRQLTSPGDCTYKLTLLFSNIKSFLNGSHAVAYFFSVCLLSGLSILLRKCGVGCNFSPILKAFKMFYQEKHPGEKSVHLFQTNKHDLLIINLLFRRQMASLMASPVSTPSPGIFTAQQGNLFCCGYGKTRFPFLWLATKKQTGRKFKNNCA